MTRSTLERHVGNRDVLGASPLRKLDTISSLLRSLDHKCYRSYTSIKWNLHITEVIYTLHVIEGGENISDFSRVGTMHVQFLLELLTGTLQAILCNRIPNLEVTH